MKLIETVFSLVATASLTSTLILLLVLLVQKLLNKRLSPRIHYALWFLVLIRLLVPVVPESHISLFNLMPQVKQYDFAAYKKAILDALTFEHSVQQRPASENSEEVTPNPYHIKNQPAEQSLFIAKPLPPTKPSATEPAQTEKDGLRDALTIGSLVWLGGFVIMLGLYFLFVSLGFRRKARAYRLLDNPEVLTILEGCKEQLGIKKSIPIYVTNDLQSPCIYGLIKPRIFLPKDIVTIADRHQLTHILLHELTHYKRKDLWFNFLWTLCVLIHWFNPAVWIAMKKMKADQEVACDTRVLEALGERESESYGMTLLLLSRLLSQSYSPRIHLSHFYEQHSQIKRRIAMITKFKKGSYKLSAAAMTLFLSLSVVTMTNASGAGSTIAANVDSEGASSSKTKAGEEKTYPRVNFEPLQFDKLDQSIKDAAYKAIEKYGNGKTFKLEGAGEGKTEADNKIVRYYFTSKDREPIENYGYHQYPHEADVVIDANTNQMESIMLVFTPSEMTGAYAKYLQTAQEGVKQLYNKADVQFNEVGFVTTAAKKDEGIFAFYANKGQFVTVDAATNKVIDYAINYAAADVKSELISAAEQAVQQLPKSDHQPFTDALRTYSVDGKRDVWELKRIVPTEVTRGTAKKTVNLETARVTIGAKTGKIYDVSFFDPSYLNGQTANTENTLTDEQAAAIVKSAAQNLFGIDISGYTLDKYQTQYSFASKDKDKITAVISPDGKLELIRLESVFKPNESIIN
ncbi:hypothetical protein C8Z91_19685 [Paenibacillus elgii]|uniref:Peptidase M56 domain-containing protein n=1 Tax=Paenibacillus elgii TaxID=189691 RepID=A0A2T6G096_9BACL|nr:M56 family metallopeptidase [Paenibacillus elgii]PUA37565.1 hypothetical protein C8Z91_19685 [Paenibacillus elgii]